jgi:hypothetical protein
MKSDMEKNLEILLRNHLGGEQGKSVPEEHLDANDISAFIENSLPEVVRAGFVDHMSECRRCRTIVRGAIDPQIVQSAAPVISTKAEKATGWRESLSSLFAVPHIRLALPVLALLLLALGTILVISRRPEAELAKVERGASTEVKLPAPVPDEVPTESIMEKPEKPQVQKRVEEKRPGSGQVAGSGGAGPVFPEASSEQDTFKHTASAPAMDALELQKPKAKAGSAPVSQAVSEELAAASSEPKSANFRLERMADANAPGEATAESRSMASGSVAQSPGVSLEGKHFSRVGNRWIDASYKSSMKLLDMPRESEHFKRLAKEQSRFRRIIERLAGEILIVWEGTAYRIY